MKPATDTSAQSPEARADFFRHRWLMVGLAVVALVVAWIMMTALSRNDPWYNSVDSNIHTVVDALAINSGVSPARVDQPGLPSRYLLALDYRVRHYAGALPVWNLKKFGDSADPVREIPTLLRISRLHARVLVLLVILGAAGLTWSVTRRLEAACLTIALLSGSAGLLFHGLLNRTDLLCTAFGTVFVPFCAWRATEARAWRAHDAWLFLAGLGVGGAFLAKLPGFAYLATAGAWCGVAALLPAGGVTREAPRFWSGLLPVAGGAAALVLLGTLLGSSDILEVTALTRLRVAAVLVAGLPLLALGSPRSRLGAFLLARTRELALLVGGALAAVVLAYAALRAVMPGPAAGEYLSKILQFLFNPEPQLKYLLADPATRRHEVTLFVMDAPFLFASALGLVVAAGFARAAPARLRAFAALLAVTGAGLGVLLSQRGFLEQFSVFVQVPQLLAWSLGLAALGLWRPKTEAALGAHWGGRVVLAAGVVLLATAWLRIEPKYQRSRTETVSPLTPVTVLYLFDHDAHPESYRAIMKSHYGTREEFAATLERFLADPANRR